MRLVGSIDKPERTKSSSPKTSLTCESLREAAPMLSLMSPAVCVRLCVS